MARDAVAEIRERVDILDLVGTYVPSLKRTGRSVKGLCPFHQEKTPSFVVFPDSQNFHCFGCGKGGDLFTFFMLVEHVEFREALRELASRAGVQLDSGAPPDPERDAFRNRLVEINELAAKFYAHVLAKASVGAAGREMIAARGVSQEMVGTFQLGFAPDSWDNLITFLAARDISAEQAFEAGLAQQRDSGGHYDRFRNRLMFPIRDRDGNTVGFGGRAMGDAVPKYLNSPQTPIFDKSSLIYGLDLARDAIRTADEVVIVEGYMDAIAAHQFGYRNVVAQMGTALTEQQVGLIKRTGKRVVLALDSDAAGQMATLRSLETVQQSMDADETPVPDAMGVIRFERRLKAEIAIVQIPEGKDPDELIRRAPESWPSVVAAAKPFLDFTIDSLVASIDLSDARAKSRVVEQLAPVLHQIPDRIVQGHYIALLARRLDLEDRLVLAEVRRVRLGARPSAIRKEHVVAEAPRPVRHSTEEHLVALLLKHPDLTSDIVTQIPPEDVQDARNRELIRVLREEDVSAMTAEQILVGLDDSLADHAESLVESLQGRPEEFPGHIQREATEMMMRLGKERFEFLLRQLNGSLRSALKDRDAEGLESAKAQIGLLAERHSQYYPRPSPYFLDSRSKPLN